MTKMNLKKMFEEKIILLISRKTEKANFVILLDVANSHSQWRDREFVEEKILVWNWVASLVLFVVENLVVRRSQRFDHSICLYTMQSCRRNQESNHNSVLFRCNNRPISNDGSTNRCIEVIHDFLLSFHRQVSWTKSMCSHVWTDLL